MTAGQSGRTGSGEVAAGAGGARRAVTRLLASVLVCEAVVVALAIPVAVAVRQVDGALAGLVCGGLAVACLVMVGLLRFKWSLVAGGVLQLLIIAAGVLVSTMYFLGLLFAALWITAIWLGHKVEQLQAR